MLCQVYQVDVFLTSRRASLSICEVVRSLREEVRKAG